MLNSEKQETDYKTRLLEKIESRNCTVGVIGMGYIGLPLAVAFAQAGFNVIGIDIHVAKVKALNEGRSYVEDISDDVLKPLVASGKLTASTDFQTLSQIDTISICVPTPLGKTKDPDVSYIIHAADRIRECGGTGKLIVLESTTYPGTTEEIILPRLCSTGDRVGSDFFLAFSPERIDPGRTDFTIHDTPKVVGGVTPNCLEVALALYGTVIDKPVPVSSTATAEMVKLLENSFRAVNIAIVNEVALMCDKLGLDVWEIVEAAGTKPYGFMRFYPGPGLGGHCIPVDPHYLSWKLRTLNFTARFIELAAEINGYMPNYVVGKITDALNEERKSLNGSNILILGVAYKANIGDVRESPAFDIMQILQEKGAHICFHDPYVEELVLDDRVIRRSELSAHVLQQADCVVVVADHAAYDWSFVTDHARLIVDSRNAIQTSGNAHVVGL